MIVVRTSAGRICHVEIVTYRSKVAAKITWVLEQGDDCTTEDETEVNAVISNLTRLPCLGSVDLGNVPSVQMDIAANRYLKAEDN